MATTLDQLIVRFDADLKGFKAGVSRVKSGLADIGRAVQQNQSRWQRWQKTIRSHLSNASAYIQKHKIVILGTLTAIAYALMRSTGEVKDYGVELDKLRKITGLSASQLSKLRYAATQEHASMTALAKGIRVLSRAMYDSAQTADNEYARAFADLGVKVTDSEGKLRNVMEVLPEIAEAMRNSGDQTTKMALAQKLLGRSGTELLPFLEMGKDSMEALFKEAERLGIVMDDMQAAKMKRFDDALTTMKHQLLGVKIEAMTPLIDAFQRIYSGMQSVSEATQAGQSRLRSFFEVFSEGLVRMYVGLETIWMTIRDLPGPVFDTAVSFAKLGWREIVLASERAAYNIATTVHTTFVKLVNWVVEPLNRVLHKIERLTTRARKLFETIWHPPTEAPAEMTSDMLEKWWGVEGKRAAPKGGKAPWHIPEMEMPQYAKVEEAVKDDTVREARLELEASRRRLGGALDGLAAAITRLNEAVRGQPPKVPGAAPAVGAPEGAVPTEEEKAPGAGAEEQAKKGESALTRLKEIGGQAMDQLASGAANFVSTIVTGAGKASQAWKQWVAQMISWITQLIVKMTVLWALKAAMKAAGLELPIPGMQRGAVTKSGGLAILHPREVVAPVSTFKQLIEAVGRITPLAVPAAAPATGVTIGTLNIQASLSRSYGMKDLLSEMSRYVDIQLSRGVP